ncbi:gamma-glutamyltransferase family protein [Chelativorans sp. J32]|uniref:gamma-glutamyltransferase family protein n=1 Tax=Chelativorans sp. J32 TaxID=935840 RepID=UPI0004B924C6|nr:gamma-glutamyltransferase [Chelativorans sp. J32]
MFAPYRSRIVGTRHMAAAGHYLAAQTALQVLEAGGNAIDAGVAGGITLGVVQSEYVGFGGVAPIMIYSARTDEVVSISGLGVWPKRTDLSVFHRNHAGRIPQGLLRTITPAAPDAWITALELYGTMSYGECAAEAMRFAREGFPMPALMAAIIADYEDDYRKWSQNAEIYLPGGKLPQAGDIFIQTDLANTIAYMIDEERAAAARGGREAGLKAARDAFYKGDIAKAIAAYHLEHGGWMREDDLAEFRVEVERAMSVTYGGAEIFTCGPWCQGPVLGQTMAMLDGVDLKSLGHNSPAYIHHLVEVLKLAYADRHALYGDPNFVHVPMKELFSAEYAQARRKLVDPARAHPGMPDPGLPTNWGRNPTPLPDTAKDPGQLDTSYVCAVDKEGNAFSATPSDGSVGAPIIPGLGFVPSARGVQSFTDPNAPAVLGPGRRPRLTPSPAFARKKGKWIMPLGSPGNDVQPQAMLQVFLNIHVFGMSLQDAIDAPRFATFSYPRSSAPHPFDPGLLKLERRIPEETREALRTLGHDARDWPEWDYAAGGVCTIVKNEKSGVLEGGSDPRRPTAVAGW